ncbi:unnamed protein product [Ceratitis capitata]|uniref:(Mediterranean fruit fly) hypothetical protein n=1 Tax=Ceratitis capitata TaxID=7213 RepID=W8BYJ6_CERCA|nr:unnamed protein product [Ceratitis capitata]
MSRIKYIALKKQNCHESENQNSNLLTIVKHKQFTRCLVFCMFIAAFQLLYLRLSFNEAEFYYQTTFQNIQNDVDEGVNYKITSPSTSIANASDGNQTQTKFFISTSQCKIPYVHPFEEGVIQIFNPKEYKYTNCTNDEAFITIHYQLNAQQYFLHLNMPTIERAVGSLNVSASDIRCCYRQIIRAGSGSSADTKTKLLDCIMFDQDYMVPPHIEYIITECYADHTRKILLQKDAFSFIQARLMTPSRNVTSFVKNSPNPNSTSLGVRKPSVLLIGIDAVSRINLRRTMPQTFRHLQVNQWIELQGYNKVGDNTFPNLIALLTSYNLTMAKSICEPTKVGGLNRPICNFIWNTFKQFGYKTAYAEDVVSLSTFNYLKKGFEQPPTDYYLRPLALAIEKNLKVGKDSGLPYCIGRKHYGEYIYNFALDYANAFPEEPHFGLFWTNSFSHNAFYTEATMDAKLLEYLKKLKANGILERSIVLFFSDHGMRWGPLLKLRSGFLEERLPMMFISVPSWYQRERPDFMKALEINQRRLTTPYDIYATMKHILEDTEPGAQVPYLNGSTRGLSIFREIPENRTCSDANIPEHWCTCVPYEIVPTKDATALNVTKMMINEINQYLSRKNITDKCSELNLKEIGDVKLKMLRTSDEFTYRITFVVNPKQARYQATVVYNKSLNAIDIDVEEISRLDSYAETSKCINLKEEKKYCICKK